MEITRDELDTLIQHVSFGDSELRALLTKLGIIKQPKDFTPDDLVEPESESCNYTFFEVELLKDQDSDLIYIMPADEDDQYWVWLAGAWEDSDPDPLFTGNMAELLEWLKINTVTP